MFPALPGKPHHESLELEILDFWKREDIFAALREKNAAGPRFSFVDGPVTANKTLGVHTAWGRTLKDVFQRYKALRGFHQRYQNGFDCQGLWIEVGVEKQLGLNSKREIEEYGLEEFAARCREVVEWSSAELIQGSIRLGQWMDWGRDYYTFADTNIEYIWTFLRAIADRGWLYKGHRATEWCPRCGTSISAHELTGSYSDREHPSLSVRFPLLDRPGESLVVWTTTPWTLPANVAAAVRPDATYGRLDNGDWVATDRGSGPYAETSTGAAMVGWRYRGPFDDLEPAAAVEHRVIPWDEVSLEEGTGIVHIAPGCGVEDFELGRRYGLPVLTPIDESGRFYPVYGWLGGMSTDEAREPIIDALRAEGLLRDAGTIVHRYPECWRCHTPLVFRISDDWFISVDEVREPMRAANRTVEWTPAYMGNRMDDWLVNMADWNISRRRYYGLPLPFYPCQACGELTVIGSRAELAERATSTLDGLRELRRPWIDRIAIRCPRCGEEVERIKEVGDVWLDAGIVPFSTLGWESPHRVPEGFGTGAARGLTTADLPEHAYWQEWFPADWVSEMREQIRLWFYSQLFMSVALTGRAPYRRVLSYEKMFAEDGREMHGSWGNMISAEEAFRRMGADVMRWQYCAQPPSQNLLFGFGPGLEIQRKVLTLWNSAAFLVQYANAAGFTPRYGAAPESGHPLDRWLASRTARLVTETTRAYEQYLTVNVLRAYESFVDDLSNWYIRRSRRRFWNGEAAALGALWSALVTALRVVSPVVPFLTEHLWQRLVVGVCPDAPRSIFLAGWPEAGPVDERLLADVAAVRRVVDLGRQARAAAKLKLRQPLRALVVEGFGGDSAGISGFLDEIADELRVKEVRLGHVETARLRVRPNLPVVAPRLGRDVPAVRRALDAGEFTARPDGGFTVAGHELGPDEVLVERMEQEGWAVASEDGVTVAFDTTLDDGLRREGRVYELIRLVNAKRREADLALTDRIALTLPASDADLMLHAPWIAAETLATSIDVAAADGEVTLVRA
jgi:isoleucyl-tRNA synthetase